MRRGWIPALVTGALVGGLWLSHLVAAPHGIHSILPRLPPTAGLAFEVRDADSDALIPCKLTLVGIEGTPDPGLTHNDVGLQEGDAVVAFNKIMSGTGLGVVHVPLGVYSVTVSRGLEWDLAKIPRVVVGFAGGELRAHLRHVIETPGWITGDFHVHAAHSPDSRVPMIDRVYEFLSDGVEIIVATDHNIISDYAPLIEEVGARKYLTSIIGDEMTTGTWGHFGAFPLPQNLEAAGQGAVLVHRRDPVEFFADVRTDAPDAIIDVHHPRLDNEIGYFNIAKLDSATDTVERPGFSFDFDALEVMNGYQDPDRRALNRTVEDWFALINHGHIVTATGNSDTHHLYFNIAGYPRNYVRVAEDKPELVTPHEIAQALRGHHAFFTTGPIIDFSVAGGGIGDVVTIKDGHARAQVRVRAAPWIDVSRVTLFLDGEPIKEWQVAPSQAVIRLDETFELGPEAGAGVIALGPKHDAWVVVRATGDKPLYPVVGDSRRFTVTPFALTNPVFLDMDGDGKFTAKFAHGPHAAEPNAPPREHERSRHH